MMEERREDSVSAAAKQRKLVAHRCIVKCFWNDILYNVGDIAYIPEGEKAPEWFEKEK